ncbi:MAG TPA: FtsX-like permease family protein, partial [Beijerinckiaceae bacterium]|nr:FtsX-like permease family protein [Beijerinckiaceae bacterium]
RDLRGGLSGFGVLIACIAIGVAAIVAVSSLARGLSDGLAREGRVILGGDIGFSLLQREASEAEMAYINRLGRVQTTAFLRAMTRAEDGGATLAELKAVGPAYPALGVLEVRPQATARDLLAARDGVFGLLADPLLTGRLGLKVGDRLVVGSHAFEIRAEIVREPDRVATGVGFGPRIIVSHDGLRASGLLQPGSLVRWTYRVTLDGDSTSQAQLKRVVEQARAAFPDAGWDIRTRENAAPQLTRNLERFTQFLTLVGLTALAVGGVGVANAAQAFTERKRGAMAVLKSVGAEGRLIFKLLLIEVLCLGAIGTAIGVVVGALAPFLVKALAGALLPFPLVTSIYVHEIAVGFAYGLLTVAAFSIWPLGRAHDIPVSALFRDLVTGDRRWPRWGYLVLVALTTGLLVAVAVLFAWDRTIALIYVAAAASAFLLLRLVALAIMALARRMPSPKRTELRLALVNMHKPGALTPSVVLSLGLGVTLLVAMGLIDHNLRNQLSRTLPEKAPSFFFLDIPAAETTAFEAMVAGLAPGSRLERVPMMRGRVTALKGVRSEQIKAHERAAWVLEGDRGITFSESPPAGSVLVQGQWWEKDYRGPPLVSFDHELAGWLGLTIGDEITVNVLGRTMTARIANLRKVEWQSLGINFVLVFSPNTFAGAPYSNLATLTFPKGATEAAEIALLKAAARQFPAVSSVRVKEALETIDTIVAQLAVAVRGASAVAILASVIVLGGALAAGRRVRAQESVILKTLGATRRRLLAAMIVEYALLGVAASLFGLAAGALAGYAIVTQVMKLAFSFPWLSMLELTITALSLVIILGLAGTWRILGQKPAPFLRNA